MMDARRARSGPSATPGPVRNASEPKASEPGPGMPSWCPQVPAWRAFRGAPGAPMGFAAIDPAMKRGPDPPIGARMRSHLPLLGSFACRWGPLDGTSWGREPDQAKEQGC